MAVKLEKGTALSSLSLTPLIDIVFLLLIFFLVATEFADEERELLIDLPSASEAQPVTAQPQQITVNIKRDGTYIMQRRVVKLDEVEAIITDAATNNRATQKVDIRGDKGCPLEYVIAVVNIVKRAKIKNYSIATSAEDA